MGKLLLERATDAENLAQEQAKINTSDPNLAAIEKVRLKREFMEQAEKKKNRHVDEQEEEVGLAGLHSARAFRNYLETQPDLKSRLSCAKFTRFKTKQLDQIQKRQQPDPI